MKFTSIIKGILLNLIRYWMASFLTLIVAHHWVTPDQQNQLTLWFNGWSDVIVTTLLAAALPFAISIYLLLKRKFMEAVARMLPAGATHEEVKEVVSNSTYGQILSVAPSTAVVRKVANNGRK